MVIWSSSTASCASISSSCLLNRRALNPNVSAAGGNRSQISPMRHQQQGIQAEGCAMAKALEPDVRYGFRQNGLSKLHPAVCVCMFVWSVQEARRSAGAPRRLRGRDRRGNKRLGRPLRCRVNRRRFRGLRRGGSWHVRALPAVALREPGARLTMACFTSSSWQCLPNGRPS